MKLTADVVVIGGGSTGAGVLRDCAMRGYRTILLDRADLGQGTSGRFHGLLHSGGRYVVSDPESATECASENAIVTRINADAVEPTGGLFVVTPDDDPAFGDRFLAGAGSSGVPATEIPVAEALAREPRLNPGIKRAFAVQDGSIDGWRLIRGVTRSAIDHGAKVLAYHKVTAIHRDGGQVTGVTAVSERTGETIDIDAPFVLNCAGPWAGQVAGLAGVEPVAVVPGRGIMIAMNHRLVNSVINRCVYPTDGDILVPAHTVCIIGTTDVAAKDPDQLAIPGDEVQRMLDAGETLVPGFRQARALHAWAGARPLIKDDRVSADDTRHMSRGMAVVDHSRRDGVTGLLTIGGGKLTTYRLMAEHIVDAMEAQLGVSHPCRTADEPCPGAEHGNHTVSRRLAEREADRSASPIVCECELVNRAMVEEWVDANPHGSFDDLRRATRVGMGPCQGAFCGPRVAGIACERGATAADAVERLKEFQQNRWIGLWPVLYGEQVRETALGNWLQASLGTRHLPATGKAGQP